MQNPVNTVTDMYQNQLQVVRKLAEAALICSGKINQTSLDAAHALFKEQMQFAQAVMSSRDAKQIALLHSSFLSHTPQCITQSQKDILAICHDMQSQVEKTVEQYFEHVGNAQLVPLIAPIAGGNGSGDAMGPMTDLCNIWNVAFREASTLATQNLEVARTNFDKVNDAILEERKAATAQTKQK